MAAAAAHANVTAYGLQRRNSYNQEPNGSGYFISSDFSAWVETTDPGDFASVAFTGPPPADAPAALTKNGNRFELFVNSGTSPDDEFMLYPLGVYTLTAAGGTLGPQTAILDDSAAPFTGAPFFTNYEHYETRTAGEPVTIEVSGFTPRAGSTHNFANYALYEQDDMGGTATLVSGVHAGSAPFSFGLPAGATRADRFYYFGVDFVSEIQMPSAGFGGATAIVRSVGSNGSSFHVFAVPEPASGVWTAITVALAAGRRRIRLAAFRSR